MLARDEKNRALAAEKDFWRSPRQKPASSPGLPSATIDQEGPVTAALLALRGMPEKFDPPNRPLIPDTAGALEAALAAQTERRVLPHDGPVPTRPCSRPTGHASSPRSIGHHRPALGRRLRPGAAPPPRPRGNRSSRPCSRPTGRASSPRPMTAPPGSGTPPPARSCASCASTRNGSSRPCSRPTGRACSPRPATTPQGSGRHGPRCAPWSRRRSVGCPWAPTHARRRRSDFGTAARRQEGQP